MINKNFVIKKQNDLSLVLDNNDGKSSRFIGWAFLVSTKFPIYNDSLRNSEKDHCLNI